MLAEKTNAFEFTVSELSGTLKKLIEDNFGNVQVRGEISGYRGPHSSGHVYFALKDEKSRLEAVIWRGTFSKLKFRPEEGMEVVVSGKLTTFPNSSKYQIVIESLKPAGVGALMAILEERKQRFVAQGLFDKERKKQLPFMPSTIGVVTSPTGAVIRDIIHRISDRFPVHLLIWPVRVQGEGAGDEISKAIEGFNRLTNFSTIKRPDLIIVARGGGSLEDLWGFNDESVVLAASKSDIPIISAVGHETDWTLLDYVADLRAPTPTGAAEFAVPVKIELEAAVTTMKARLVTGINRHLQFLQQKFINLVRNLPSLDQLLALPRRSFDELSNRLDLALINIIKQWRLTFERYRGGLMFFVLERFIALRKRELLLIGQRLNFNNLLHQIKLDQERLSTTWRRAEISFRHFIEIFNRNLNQSYRLMQNLSYKATLDRGFVLVFDAQKTPILNVHSIKPQQNLTLQFSDGHIQVQSIECVGSGKRAESAKQERNTKQVVKKQKDADQGSLF